MIRDARAPLVRLSQVVLVMLLACNAPNVPATPVPRDQAPVATPPSPMASPIPSAPPAVPTATTPPPPIPSTSSSMPGSGPDAAPDARPGWRWTSEGGWLNDLTGEAFVDGRI